MRVLTRIALRIVSAVSPQLIFGSGRVRRVLRRFLLRNSFDCSVPTVSVGFELPTEEPERAYVTAPVDEEIEHYLARLRMGV